MYNLMLFYAEKPGILKWARKISSLFWHEFLLYLKWSQVSCPLNTAVNINTLIVLKEVKAAKMSNLEEPIDNISAWVFRAGFGQ